VYQAVSIIAGCHAFGAFEQLPTSSTLYSAPKACQRHRRLRANLQGWLPACFRGHF
jgi:hypothetical protein